MCVYVCGGSVILHDTAGPWEGSDKHRSALSDTLTRVSPCAVFAGSQSDAPHRSARLAWVFSALCPVMAAVHLPLGCLPHLPLLSQKEQQRLHYDVHHEQIQNGERAACCCMLCNCSFQIKASFMLNRIKDQSKAKVQIGLTPLSPVQTQ